MMETMEYRYHDALAAADSMSDKARVSIELLDSMLSDVEMRAHKLRQRGLQNMTDAAEIVIGEGRHVLDKGLDKARGVVEEGLRGAKHAAESLEDKIQKAMLRAKEHGLISYEDLPVPWRVNPHIVRGYRFTETYSGCIRSAFGVSNELVNIWSHAIGLVLVLSIAFYFYPTSINFHLSTNADVLIAALFFFAACQCLVCSTIWHTMNAITDVNLISTFACVDYTGISLLIAASIMTTEYTAFYCEPVSRWIYMVVTGLLGIGGVILPWNPTFNRADMAWARVAFFVFLGATGFLVSGFRNPPPLPQGRSRCYPSHFLWLSFPPAPFVGWIRACFTNGPTSLFCNCPCRAVPNSSLSSTHPSARASWCMSQAPLCTRARCPRGGAPGCLIILADPTTYGIARSWVGSYSITQPCRSSLHKPSGALRVAAPHTDD